MRTTKFGRSIFALLMTFVMVFHLVSPIVTFAAISDRDTSTKYTESLGDNVSTEYAGRVWTDKSVFDSNVTFDAYGGGEITVKINENGGDAENFLIAYSALATAKSISGQSQAPVDVVLILDISGSMSNSDSNMDNRKSRIYNTVQAANEAIDTLMELNPYNRVAVAAFSSNAQVLLPLDRYTTTTEIQEEWVQTGPFSFNGYWKEIEVEVPYLRVSPETASNNYADLTVKAQGSSGVISETVAVEGGTNIQLGLYEGMQILATESATTANINGNAVQRTPSVILLSDGSPTYSSDSESWWTPDDNHDDGPGSSAYAGNGMKAILTGAYMKDAIDRNYKVAGTAYATTVYTVGMGITGLSDTEKNLAQMTLDPGAYWNDNSVRNTIKTTIKEYWSAYTARNNTGTLNINVGRLNGNRYADKNYYLTHPTTGYDVDPVSGYDYVDDYYDADNASAVTDVFEQIVANIAISAPQVPTEIKGDDPLTDGYITYTDPIGKYMEVKDVKSIIYAGTEFTQKAVSVNGNVTSYTFSGEVHSPVYGDQEIKNILITVETAADGSQVLTVKIPASVIPLRVNEVTLNEDGSVKTHTNNGAFPTRVVYSVGLQDGIKKVSDDGHEYVDATQLSDAYIAANTNADGSINFYSNVFSNTYTVNGATAGDAKVEFEPAHTNPFYYIQEDMPIYKDREFLQQVTAQEGLADDAVYYYKEEFYHGSNVETLAIARTGVQLKATSVVTGADGNLYREAGSPRLNRILEFEGTKVENATGTAEDFYAPTFQVPDGSTNPFDGKFVIHHGNNGVVSLSAGGNLEIRKDVAAAAGLTAPGENFVFTVDINNGNINGNTYRYVIRDDRQNEVSTGTISAANNTITLSDGQTATVYSLAPMTTYTVTEAPVAGFTAESEGATGTIHAGQTQQVLFTNTYSVTPVVSEQLEGKKILAGRAWAAGDSFTFFLSPYNNCPLPVGYDPDAGVTVTAPDVAGGSEASFEFGSIEFTAPGVYRYTVVEKEPENDGYLPGMTYSRALYRIVIVVKDNGNGTLSIQSSDIQRIYDDKATPLFTYDGNNQIVMNPGQEGQDEISFTNTYAANSVIRVPVALKAYSDPSGTKPLLSGMFQFQLKAIGYMVDGGALVNDITKVPMPGGSQNGVIVTTNEGHDVTFPAVEFTQNVIPTGAQKITFRYEMSEIIPQNPAPGMVYDDTVYSVDVVVEIDPGSADLLVSAIYPDDLRIATFENRFNLAPVTAKIQGTKTLHGRDMLAGESFEFTLVDANAATNNAVRDGFVVVPNSFATVQGGQEGTPVAFSFDDILFTRPGTYTFLVSETRGSAPAVTYDDANIAVTFEIADTDGDADLDVVSTTYSNGGASADFVNRYNYAFNDTPVDLYGTKNLTGKSLLEGEFFFNIREYYNGSYVTERLVSHTGDAAASGGTYSGDITFLEGITYSEPGTYVYEISEQIPDDAHKVKGTTYDYTDYRFTVVVADDSQGNLIVTSKTLERNVGNGWAAANAIVFNNSYVPESVKADLPLIRKVLSGDRSVALKAGEFSFRIAVLSADPADGITLPAETVVYNAENGNVAFGSITFTKAGSYSVSIEEVIPDDADKVPGVTYSTQRIVADFLVTDDRNGQLTATLTQFHGGDTIINTYVKQPTNVAISGTKELIGGGLQAGDYSFSLYETGDTYDITGLTALHTVSNGADGSFTFDSSNVSALDYNAEGIHYYVLTEETANPQTGIRYDTRQFRIKVEVTDNGLGSLVAEVTCENGDENALVFYNVPYEDITEKDVFLTSAPTVSIDGKAVNPGDVLSYTISYHNYTGEPADVIITDQIPGNTTFLSADNGGVLSGGKITWTFTGVPHGTEKTVSFQVEVNETTQTLENQAVVEENGNRYETNLVTNPVEKDEVTKDVYRPAAPTVSIDGKKVEFGDVLLYKITYTNSDDFPADVTITDQIPALTTYVEGSADNGGVLSGGKLTWNLHLEAGQSKTVSFQVKVNTHTGVVENQAVALEDGNEVKTEIITNPVDRDLVEKNVYLASAPTVSIDGKKVEFGDVLFYRITYTNVDDEAATVIITDKIPGLTTYVNGSADNGGTLSGDTLTWVLSLDAGESATVSFRVKVNGHSGVVENKATALSDGNELETNVVTNPVTEDETTKTVYNPAEPTVSIDGKAVEFGDILEYAISYTNADDAAAVVTITDQIPAHTTYVEGSADNGGVLSGNTLTWTLELAAGQSKTVTFRVKVDAHTGTVENQAVALEGGNQVSTNAVTNPVKQDEAVKDVFLPAAPTVSIDGQKVAPGEILQYTITYTNADDAPATVTITDQIPAHTTYVEGSADNSGVLSGNTLTWELNLAAGQSKTVSFQVKVNEAKAFIDNQAVALEGGNRIETNVVTNHTFEDESSKDVALASKPGISIDGQLVEVGQILEYTIDYTNFQDAPVNVVITDRIPAHTKLHNAGSGTADNGVITWQLQNVQPRQTVTVTFQVEVLDPGAVIENQAQIFDGTNKTTNKVTSATPEKTVDKQTVSAGETLTYRISFTNTTGAVADAIIRDELDSALAYVEGSAGTGVHNNGVITWNLTGIAPGETVTVTFQATVKPEAVKTQISNVAQIIQNNSDAVFTNGTVTGMKLPKVAIEKTQALGNGTATKETLAVKAGDTVTYFLKVTNTGEGAANGLTITDKIPAGLRYVEASANNGGKVENGVVSWNVETLAAGASVTLQFKVTVPVVEKDTEWTNIAAVVYGNNPDGVDPIETNPVKSSLKVPATPPTGDPFPMAFCFGLTAVSTACLVTVLVLKKKEEEAQ